MLTKKAVFSSVSRAIVLATVAAVTVSTMEPSPARAGSAPSGKGVMAASAGGGATDFSARRRYYRGGGGAAAAGVFAAIVGTGIAIAAAQNRRAYYDDYYGGYGGPVYDGGPAYYGYGGASYGDNAYGATVPYFHGHPNPGW